MTLTPSTVRQDLKCGKGSISKGEKCTKGPATAAKTNNTIRNVAIAAGAAAVVGGAIYGVHKFRRANAVGAAPSNGNKQTPEEQISRGKKAFREVHGVALGTQIAGAGLTTAGGALVAGELSKKDRKKRNAAVIGAGALLAYTGLGTINAGGVMRQGFREAETEWTAKAEDYKRQYYGAREAAQQRAREQAASGSQGTRNVGANRAVANPYKDLGVPESASDAQLKAAWKKLMTQHHPDRGGDPEKAAQVNAAYQEAMRRRGKLDSAFADGFTIDWEALAL